MKLAIYLIAVLVFGSSVPEAESFTVGMILLVGFIVSAAMFLTEVHHYSESNK